MIKIYKLNIIESGKLPNASVKIIFIGLDNERIVYAKIMSGSGIYGILYQEQI